MGSTARASDLAERVAATRRIDRGIVELLRAHTNSFRLVDRQLGACAVFEQLACHIAQIETLCESAGAPGTGPGLATALAEASTLAGWQALDLGMTTTAWSYYELAKSAAREAGDPNVLAHATAEQAYVLIDSGRHEEAIEQVAAAKGQIQRLPPRLAAWLHSAEAEVHAVAAAATVAQRSLELAAARCPASPADSELPYLALDEVHLERWRGCTLAYLGDPAAVRQLSGALVRMDRTFTRAAAGLHSDLALALARAGERDEARHHMHRAQRLADMVGSARQRRRTHERAAALFGRTVPAR
jgi:tetratricopeptide (TPR) repeat protein